MKSTHHIKDFDAEYRLSDEFCHHHFLVGVILQEIRASLLCHETRRFAITVLKNLMAKHAYDDRYQGKAQQARIAALYLPLVSILVENASALRSPSPDEDEISTPVIARRSNGIIEPTGSLPASARDSKFLSMIAGQGMPTVSFAVNGSCHSMDSAASDPSTLSDKSDNTKGHCRSQSVPFSNSSSIHLDKIESSDLKDLLVCFLYIIKHLNEDLLIGWWHHSNEYNILEFFQILELCLHQFKYMGKKNIKNLGMHQPKSMTLPARIAPPTFGQNPPILDRNNEAPGDAYRALLEANMATEVGLIALDVLGLYCLQVKEEEKRLQEKVFDIYLSFLQVGQSERMLGHLFAALRALVNKFTVALFGGDASLCGKLCFELLRCCNSNLQTIRCEACVLLYLLMRSNFDSSGRISRLHLQLIVSVSRLLGDVSAAVNNARLQESLSLIDNYADSDKAKQNTVFPAEVKELTLRIRTVLQATLQMKEHEGDPEMLQHLQHRLANSYAATPALRSTWLQSMARNHIKNGDYSEAAHCYIHIAAMEAEYLKQKCMFPVGVSAFSRISPNVAKDESSSKEDDSGTTQDTLHYSQASVLCHLETSVRLLEQAERYEAIADIYRIAIPIYEEHRDNEALLLCYKTLHHAYSRIVEVTRTGRRLLGKYYRVAFFGTPFFVAGKEEYIYKEPKVTSLSEISERLHRLYSDKFGKDSVKLIMDSNKVDPSTIDPRVAHIQVTHVIPYFGEEGGSVRSEFERHHNVERFVFETPFTLEGGKARGTPEQQCKRRTVLTSKAKLN